MRLNLIPREEQYFDLIDQAAKYLVEGAAALEAMCADYTKIEEKVSHIDGLEHACDEICHTTLDKLDKTFITPLDREDIHELILRIDDVLDMINGAASRFVLYGVKAPTPPAIRLVSIIRRQVGEVETALRCLRNPRTYGTIGVHLIEIHRLENEADDLIRQSIGDLFRHHTDPIDLVRWKGVYEELEAVTDCAEDVANVIQGITVKMA
jgi:uncharacterized protein